MALLVLHARLGLFVVDPRDVAWMQYSDWPNYLFGWSFYRWDSWRLPVGYFSNLLHPVGTSTGLTDSIPWLAVTFKMLDPWLPRSFQYFGAYLLLCFFLQGFVGFRIMMLLSRDRLHSMLSAAFLMVAPVLLDRIQHIALCSHWMILALILCNVSSVGSPQSSAVWRRKATALNLLAAATHPYLWAMTFVLSLPLFARPRREESAYVRIASSFVFWALLQIVLAAVAWWVFGYLMLGSAEESGFADYGGGLSGFFNSAGKMAFTPQIRAVSPEAFDFTGLGISLIAAILIATSAKRWMFDSRGRGRKASGPWLPSSPLFPLFLTATALWLYSLARLAPLFSWLGPLTGTFRGSGRFSWPLYYCVVLFLLARYRRAFPSRLASAALLLLLEVQVWDLSPYWLPPPRTRRPIPQVGADPFWRGAGHAFRHLVIWPQGSGGKCGDDRFGARRTYAFLFLADDQRMTINVGATSRAPLEKIQAACEVTRLALSEDRPEPETLYVLAAEVLSTEALASLREFSCHEIDAFQVCAAAPFDPRAVRLSSLRVWFPH